MNEELEALAREALDGELDPAGRERLAAALEADPAALAEFVDQLQVQQRLGAALREDGDALPAAVVREIRLLGDAGRFSREVVGRLKRPARGRWWELAAAGLVLGTLAFFLVNRDGGIPAASGGPGGVLFVVGRLPLEADDRAVQERLERLAGPVTVRTGLEVTTSECRGRTLIAVSSTSLAREVIGVLRDVPVPIVVWEPFLYHDLGLIPGNVHKTDWAAARDQTDLVITAPGHPLAAGLSGRVRVSSAPGQFSWGRVGPEAVAVAVLENDPSRAAVFGVERGASRPARRAGLFLFDTTATTLTGQGWSLFDAAVRWCIADAR